MSMVLALLSELLHIGLMLAAAPTLAGMAARLDARMSGRAGPPVLAPWRDLIRLARKTPMAAENVSIVSRIGPAVGLGAMLSAAALVPSFTVGMALSPLADVVVIVSLLTVARVAAALVAFDSGAALPGLAAQHASASAVLAEPALMLSVVTLGLMGGSLNLDAIIGQQREGLLLPAGASAVVATGMLALLLVDSSAPVAGLDHATHGLALAMSRITGWLRRLVWIDLIGGLFMPVGMAAAGSGAVGWVIGVAAWGIKLAAFVVALSVIHWRFGGMPRDSLVDLIGLAALLVLLATIMALASAGTA